MPESDIRNRQGSVIPFFYVDAVVEMPFGAVPGNMPGYYYCRASGGKSSYGLAARATRTSSSSSTRWVFGVKDQFEFVDKLGGAKWIAEARIQTKAAEGDHEDIDFSYEEYTRTHDSGSTTETGGHMKDLSAPANPLEMLAFILASHIKDNEVVYVGTGLPMIAGILAKKTHAPNITMVYESGGQDPLPGDMPWSVGCPFTWRKSPVVMEMSYSFAQCYNGYVDIAFLGFAQVDMYGNVNTHQIGKDLHNPKVRMTGSGGNNDLSSLTEEVVLVGVQTPDKFPKEVESSRRGGP